MQNYELILDGLDQPKTQLGAQRLAQGHVGRCSTGVWAQTHDPPVWSHHSSRGAQVSCFLV